MDLVLAIVLIVAVGAVAAVVAFLWVLITVKNSRGRNWLCRGRSAAHCKQCI